MPFDYILQAGKTPTITGALNYEYTPNSLVTEDISNIVAISRTIDSGMNETGSYLFLMSPSYWEVTATYPYTISNATALSTKQCIIYLDFKRLIALKTFMLNFDMGGAGTTTTLVVSGSADGATYTDYETITTTSAVSYTKSYEDKLISIIKLTFTSQIGGSSPAGGISFKKLQLIMDSYKQSYVYYDMFRK